MDTSEHSDNTGREASRNNANESPEKDLVYAIVGSAFEVLKEIGHGIHEKPYEEALVIELRLRGLQVDQQRRFPILYKQQPVGEFIPGIIVENRVVVDAKTIERITEHEKEQMLNYLRIAKLRVGVTLNFKYAKLQWERTVL